ncbi:LPS export ABC transporter periplasmic protein LptC [Tropicimonas sp. IMCC34043]|uniref:LPS export ABC transporter periplasmic protein LptC n=1 Tax=Tropicimonas sp. IMCC34043 TaxID=2248760 RepID=UPI000E240D09|nr:LPS export ABC transporter periplasmic protein LptC [Tropicimonas sp. IMCC34043]
MARADNLHSHVVAWLKVILPIVALGLLSTLFLVPRRDGPADPPPYSEQELEEMVSERRIDRPMFNGTTNDGRAIRVWADTAFPRAEDSTIVDTTRMRGTLETADGGQIEVESDSGTIFSGKSLARLIGNVRVTTSTGYTIVTDDLTSALDQIDMESAGPVTGTGPFGKIDAGRMNVTPDPDHPDAVVVVFQDGVKLIYTPKTE